MIRRTPLLVRLTAAYSLAMLLVVLGAAAWVSVRLRGDLDDRVDESLRARSAVALVAATAQGDVSGVPVDEPQESFVQLLRPDGRIANHAGGGADPAASSAEVARAASAGLFEVERETAGVDGRVRIRLIPVREGPRRGWVVVIGQSLLDRDEAVASVLRSFAVGGVVAVVVAGLIGWQLAKAGLRPVEAMRRRAAEISVSGSPESLPLPDAHDQIRRLGETLNTMLERLRDGLERERRFTADASHEIRTPLAVIRTELEAALRQSDLVGSSREAIEAAHRESQRLGRLADDLLVLARLDAGRVPLRPVSLEVAPMLWAVRDVQADQAASAGRFITVDVAADLTGWGDPDRIRQLLTNLVDNALRHGAGTVTLSAAGNFTGIELAVTDEGPGLPPDLVERAFQPFSRGHTTRGDGAGLGLAIVHAIAEAHGGRAWIDPEVSSVRIWLPGEAAVEGKSQAAAAT